MIPPLSLRNELRVLLELMDIVHKRTQMYPRTLSGDMMILEEYELSRNSKNAL